MLSSGCDDRECRVRIGYAIVRVCDVRKRHVPAWGIRMELLWIVMPAWGNPDGVASEILPLRRSIFSGYPTSKFYPGDVPTSPDISHSMLDAGWERRAFQLPRLDISGSADSTYPESFATIFCTVLRCSPEASRYLRLTF